MSKKFDLPLLSALPAFESAARRLSFTRASEELNLTQSAVSFQVRKLETSLGVQFFVRKHRELALTAEGRSFLKAVQNAFAILDAEKAMLSRRNGLRLMTISASISLSSKWLIPRLHKLDTEDAGIALRVDATDRLVDLSSEPVDLAIRYCEQPPSEHQSRVLFTDTVFPVCSSRVREALGENPALSELARHPLLHDDMLDQTWRDWLGPIGLDDLSQIQGHRFSHTVSAIDAAVAHQGIALGRLPLVADDIATGRLVRPFPDVASSRYAYYAIWQDSVQTDTAIHHIVDWLVAEAKATTVA